MADTPPPAKNRFNFRQFLTPAWLAGVLSVGFHGALFAAGPTFPNLGFNQLTEAEATEERRNVPLVELTAAEQERLPDFSGSFYDFGTFSDLEPLPPLAGDRAGVPNANGNDGSLNSQPLLSPGSRSTPPSASRLPFGITRLESRPGSSLPFPGGGLPPIRDGGSTSLPGDSAIAPNSLPSDNSAAADSPPGAEALRPEAGDFEVSPQEEAEIAANSNPTDTLSLEERLQAYAFDSANTETEAIATRYGEWLETGQTLATDLAVGEAEEIQTAFEAAATAGILPAADDEAAADADDEAAEPGIVQRPIELAIDYGAGICLTKEPQKGLIGAWVGPAGDLLGEPTVIRSTGYLGLNQQAIRYIETLDFSTVETFTGYQFEVVVNYDPEDCVDIGRSTPAAPSGDASPEGDRSDTGSKAPAKAPAERPRSADDETPPRPATDESAAPEETAGSASESDAPNGDASEAETPVGSETPQQPATSESTEPSDDDG